MASSLILATTLRIRLSVPIFVLVLCQSSGKHLLLEGPTVDTFFCVTVLPYPSGTTPQLGAQFSLEEETQMTTGS